MIRPVPLKQVKDFPATAGVAVAAVGVTLLFWNGYNIGALTMNGPVWSGEPWRLLTSALPHGDVLHLFFNVYWLWVLGARIEARFGSFRTLALYALLAVGSAAAEHALFQGGIGLSGVGYGTVGLLAVAYRRDPKLADAMDRDTAILFLLWFFLCIGLTYAGVWRIANVAHGVGALLGILVALAIYSEGLLRHLFAGLVALSLLLSGLGSSVLRSSVNLQGRGLTGSSMERDLQQVVGDD